MIVVILLVIAIILSAAAFIQTHTILRELSTIKKHLGMREENKPTFFNRDLDG